MLSLRAARERERERESSLRTSSSSLFKKSFTLIELSIVLLILSLLVGSLLVGRQIVDRAKIQRIIFEFDYYEKAFHQFYDTYRAVPGSLSYKECIKHAEFQGPACGNTDYACQNGTGKYTYNFTHDQWCERYGLTVSESSKLISSKAAFIYEFGQLRAAGLIPNDDKNRNSAGSVGGQNSEHTYYIFGVSPWRQNFNQTSFDSNVYLRMYAFHSKFGISRYKNAALSDNCGQEYFLKRIFDKNVIIMYGLIFDGKQNSAYSAKSNKLTSALNAKLASELDAKIDDGRPTTGALLGIKPSKAYNETDAERSKQYCYDAAGNDIEHAIYNASTNTQYGCDLIKVMEPVK